MPFTCRNGREHKHNTTYEARVCWGLIAPQETPRPFIPSPPTVGTRTARQLQYIIDLGGDGNRANLMSFQEASKYIDELKAANREERKVSKDPRLTMLDGLIDRVPDGYYAVARDNGIDIDFLRISRPVTKPGSRRRQYDGALKVQTKHSDDLVVAAVQWPKVSNTDTYNWSIYKPAVIDMLMRLVVNWQGAAQLYAQKLNQCMRCNKDLTDARSRWYGIGPECETKPGWEWVIGSVEEKKGAFVG